MEINYLPAIRPVYGDVDDGSDPDVIVGAFGSRIKHGIKKALGGLGRVASVVARVAPPPFSTAARAAAGAANTLSRLGRGDPQARANVQQLNRVAQSSHPAAPRARAALGLLRTVAQGRVPAGVAMAIRTFGPQGQATSGAVAVVGEGNARRIATSSRRMSHRLAVGDPQARASIVALRQAAARGDQNAITALHSIRTSYRRNVLQNPQVAGVLSDIQEGARLLWDRWRPHVGVRTQADIVASQPTMRQRYTTGVDLIATRPTRQG